MVADEEGNTAKQLMEWFSSEDKPCKAGEFMAFWKSLTEAEKVEFRTAELN